jgi:hypothetical protein
MQESILSRPLQSPPPRGVVAALLPRWPVLFGAMVAGALAGALLATALPKQYEGAALIKIGTVAGRLIETPAQTTERINLDGFLQAAALPGNPPPQERRSRVSVRVVRGADLVELRYRDSSPDAARTGAQSLFDALRVRHEEVAQPLLKRLDDQLAEVTRIQTDSRQQRERMVQDLRSAIKGPIKDEYPYLQLAFVGRDVEMARWEAALRAERSPPNTEPTRLMEAVSASDRPVSPRPLRVMAAGAALGLMFGAAWAWLRARRDPAWSKP